jgi:hypothetical protein
MKPGLTERSEPPHHGLTPTPKILVRVLTPVASWCGGERRLSFGLHNLCPH